jgi:hypothetical protein
MRIKRNIYTEVCAVLEKSELPHAFAPVGLAFLQHLRENNFSPPAWAILPR